ncbi:hypothetical protein J2129_000665 [Methanofollis sp. W23]|nr:hypothetical protein [Methanofollis sp. W23]
MAMTVEVTGREREDGCPIMMHGTCTTGCVPGQILTARRVLPGQSFQTTALPARL